MPKVVLAAFFCCLGAVVAPAQLLVEAVDVFPAQTTSLEYDALAKLRALPNYRALRKQYAGQGLERARKDLALLGITEEQLNEVVTASGPNGFFGLLAGSFHAAAALAEAARHGMSQSALASGPAFCSKDAVCFALDPQQEGRVWFGSAEQLRAMLDVRQGRAASLRANATFMTLLNRKDPHAPVFGVAPGREMGAWIGPSLPQAISSRLDLDRLFSNIETFGYSVNLDSKAHVGLNLLCSSEQTGTILRDTLSAASGLERAAAAAAGSSALPFDNMVVQSSGRMVAVNLDAPIQ